MVKHLSGKNKVSYLEFRCLWIEKQERKLLSKPKLIVVAPSAGKKMFQ